MPVTGLEFYGPMKCRKETLYYCNVGQKESSWSIWIKFEGQHIQFFGKSMIDHLWRLLKLAIIFGITMLNVLHAQPLRS